MKAEELKTKTGDELETMLGDLKKQQFNLRFQRSQGQLQNTAQIGAVRRDIARVKTFLGHQQAGVAAPKKPAGKVAKQAAEKAEKAPAKTEKAKAAPKKAAKSK